VVTCHIPSKPHKGKKLSIGITKGVIATNETRKEYITIVGNNKLSTTPTHMQHDEIDDFYDYHAHMEVHENATMIV
jgi:hypothetical protein